MQSIWSKIEPLLPLCDRPSRYLNHEWGSTYKQAPFNFCMCYPDTYELGQANQAVRILCNQVNAQDGFAAQRCYLPAPDFSTLLRQNQLSIFSIEGCNPLREFDAIGITIPHELAATNICEMLDLAGVCVCANERLESDPIILGGGPCALNPEPYSLFFDAITIGEGEQTLLEQLRIIAEGRQARLSRHDILKNLAAVSGTYVPSLYEIDTDGTLSSSCAPRTVNKRVNCEFAQTPAYEPCIVPFAEVVHDRLNIEILRGCARGCRFCQAGMMYRPVRERSLKNIVESVNRGLKETGYDEVSLTSLSSTDHSQIKNILKQLNESFSNKGIQISIPSQRMDCFGVEMAELVSGAKKGGLTFAPEAGTQRLRDAINKNVTEDDIFSSITSAFRAGWNRCKLYFMIGLPTETDEDVIAIAHLAEEILNKAKTVLPDSRKKFAKITISLALFVPKAQTPFQWDGQISKDEALRRVNLVRSNLHCRSIDVNWHDPKTSTIEAVLSRGGREISAVVYQAWLNGAKFDAWTEHFNQGAWDSAASACSIDLDALAQADFEIGKKLPWSHISIGVDESFLIEERKKADAAITTPDCTLERCCHCGVCSDLKIGNVLAENREQKRHEEAR